MTRRTFLDVGAHKGESLAAALDPAFGFDRIVCFEPAPTCWPSLEKRADKRVTIERFGLWNKTGKFDLFDPGDDGASMWLKKKPGQMWRPGKPRPCEFRRASDWFNDHISFADTVWMKLNCEGAECDILDDLLDSGEFEKVSYCMIDFDVRKIEGMGHREGQVRSRLAEFPFPRWTNTKIMTGETHQERIKSWLRLAA